MPGSPKNQSLAQNAVGGYYVSDFYKPAKSLRLVHITGEVKWFSLPPFSSIGAGRRQEGMVLR
jgi:hypothetical protein